MFLLLLFWIIHFHISISESHQISQTWWRISSHNPSLVANKTKWKRMESKKETYPFYSRRSISLLVPYPINPKTNHTYKRHVASCDWPLIQKNYLKITKNNKITISKCLRSTLGWRSAKSRKFQRITTDFKLSKAHICQNFPHGFQDRNRKK